MACTVAASRSWFFGENGSIDGGMIETLSSANHDGTYSRRENAYASTELRCGRKKLHPARVASFSQLTPIWQRHTTWAPARANGSARPAVCGSCSNATSPGWIRSSSSAALAVSILV